MEDIELLVEQLRLRGHSVTDVRGTPANAGDYEFNIDGDVLNLAEARELLEADEAA